MLACTKSNFQIIEYLINKNANLNQVNKDGWNAFQIAIRFIYFRLWVVSILILINHLNNCFLFFFPPREGHENIVSFLLSKDKSLAYRVKTRNNRTPLHTACLHSHLNIVKLLLQTSQDKLVDMLNSRDSCGNSALMEAVLGDNISIVKYLIDNYSV
jgi:ankyrin repeat protein